MHLLGCIHPATSVDAGHGRLSSPHFDFVVVRDHGLDFSDVFQTVGASLADPCLHCQRFSCFSLGSASVFVPTANRIPVPLLCRAIVSLCPGHSADDGSRDAEFVVVADGDQ